MPTQTSNLTISIKGSHTNKIAVIAYGGTTTQWFSPKLIASGIGPALQNQGFILATFDYQSNRCKSSQTFNDFTLDDRIRDLIASLKEIHHAYPDNEITLIGISMGGYCATIAAACCPETVDHLLLVTPAAYDLKARYCHFGPEFSSVIRQPISWDNSDAFWYAEQTIQPVIIIYYENDRVVPINLVGAYSESFKARKLKPRVETSLIEGPYSLSGHKGSYFEKDKVNFIAEFAAELAGIKEIAAV